MIIQLIRLIIRFSEHYQFSQKFLSVSSRERYLQISQHRYSFHGALVSLPQRQTRNVGEPASAANAHYANRVTSSRECGKVRKEAGLEPRPQPSLLSAASFLLFRRSNWLLGPSPFELPTRTVCPSYLVVRASCLHR